MPYKKNGFSIKNLLSSFSTAEIKLLILFCYYWFIIVLVTTTISVILRTFDSQLENRTNAWIYCTAGGVTDECESIREEIEDKFYGALALIWITGTFQALIGWVTLLAVIEVSDVKAVYAKILLVCSSKTQ